MTWRDKLAQKANGMLPAGEYGMYLKRELLEIVAEIDSLISERDDARQLYCGLEAEDSAEDGEELDVAEHEAKEREIADSLGWDCFKRYDK